MELFQPLQYSKEKFPLALPVPSHDTYFDVLRMYSSKHLVEPESSTVDIQTINEAPIIALSIVERMKSTKQLALRPSPIHYNQVLCAYANSNRRNRSLEAASLLYELNQQKHVVDSSSFSHTLRACCPPTADTTTTTTTTEAQQQQHQQQVTKFSEMALVVAQRVWKGLQQRLDEEKRASTTQQDHLSDLLGDTITGISSSTVEFQSYHFVHMLRVGRNYMVLMDNNNKTTTTTTAREKYKQHHTGWITSTLQECFDEQKVNIFVIQELVYHAIEITKRDGDNDEDEIQWLQSISSSLPNLSKQEQHELQVVLDQFSSRRKQATPRLPGRIAKAMLQKIPTKYKINAD